MKKLLPLFFIAFGMSTASADVIISTDNDIVSDGDVVTFTPTEIWENNLSGEMMYDLDFMEKIYISAIGYVETTVYITSDDYGFQICWPINCRPVSPGTEVSTTGMVTPDPKDLQIHCFTTVSEEDMESDGYLSAYVTVVTEEDETMSFTVRCQFSDIVSAVKATDKAQANVIEIYDMAGRKRNEIGSGVNIVKYSDGTYRKILGKK